MCTRVHLRGAFRDSRDCDVETVSAIPRSERDADVLFGENVETTDGLRIASDLRKEVINYKLRI